MNFHVHVSHLEAFFRDDLKNALPQPGSTITPLVSDMLSNVADAENNIYDSMLNMVNKSERRNRTITFPAGGNSLVSLARAHGAGRSNELHKNRLM